MSWKKKGENVGDGETKGIKDGSAMEQESETVEPPEISKRSPAEWRKYIEEQLALGKDIEDIMPKSLKPFVGIKEESVSIGFT